MKFLVFSDSHGSTFYMKKALSLHPDAEVIFHLGDGVNDLSLLSEYTRDKAVFTVNGNYEDSFFPSDDSKRYDTLNTAGVKFFFCHGHRFLSGGYLGDPFSVLINKALSKECDVALFGHTHRGYERYIPPEELPFKREKGLYLFNPGSISLPRDGGLPSYGIIEARDNGILFSHARIGEETRIGEEK